MNVIKMQILTNAGTQNNEKLKQMKTFFQRMLFVLVMLFILQTFI